MHLGSGPIENFLGEISDVVLLLMPGRVGLVAIDSFALGTPIVSTDSVFHAPEFEYLNARNSVVTADTLEAFVEGVTALLEDRPRLRELSSECRRLALVYSIERMADAFATGIHKALYDLETPIENDSPGRAPSFKDGSH